MRIIDRYFDGFETVQAKLRGAIQDSIHKRIRDFRALCQKTRVDPAMLNHVMQGSAYVDQALLQKVSFPLGIVPTRVLHRNLAPDELAEVRAILCDEDLGCVEGAGGLGLPPVPGPPSKDECETTLVFMALSEMDKEVETKLAQQHSD